MTETQGHDFEKGARQAVATGLGEGGPAKAAQLIALQIGHAARVAKDAHRAVVETCRGGMDAVHLAGLDVAETALKVLEALPNMSLMTRVGPEEFMSWVMEGIAEVTPLIPPETRDSLRTKIGERFMGADEVFGAFCEKAIQKSRS